MRGLVNERERTAVITGDIQKDAQLYRDLSVAWEHDMAVQVAIDGAEYRARVESMNMLSHLDKDHAGWDARLFDLHKIGETQ